MDIHEAQRRTTQILGSQKAKTSCGFGDDARFAGRWQKVRVSRERFPVPGLVYLLLSRVVGLKCYGPWEKMVWGFHFEHNGQIFALQFEKFGLRAYGPELADDTEEKSIARVEVALQRIEKSLRHIEPYFAELVRVSTDELKVTVPNLYHQLDERYRFFRERAKTAYASKPEAPRVIWQSEDGKSQTTESRPFQPVIEGGYFAGAMLDAFFSKLEHELVVVLPFSDAMPRVKNLTSFIGSFWGDKWKLVLSLENTDSARLYGRLRVAKERIRNVLGHGGFEKRGASLLVHSEAGAIRAALSRHKDSIHFNLFPIPHESFDELCGLLDAVEEYLEETLGFGAAWLKSGLDVCFDDASREKYRNAMGSEDDFQQLIERTGHEADMYANMDF